MGLRIVLVSREFPPDHGGGIGAYAARMVPALAEAGASVHVITRRLRSGESELEPVQGVTLHRVEMGDRSGESCLRASLVVAQKLVELVRGGGIDAIEFAEYEAMGSAWLALRSLDERAARVPVAVHLHSPTELNAELNGQDPASLDRWMRELIEAERRCIVLADGVCAPGGFMAEWAQDRFGLDDRPTVIPYAASGVSVIPVSGESRIVLYAGRLEQRKGVDTLIRAWNRAGAKHPDWTLRLVGADTNTAPGGGSCREWLESLLDPALKGRTVFVGAVDGRELERERSGAALAVIPSRWENFPNTCIEAMASGLPIVASDHGGMAEMLGLGAMGGAQEGHCGCVIAAGDDAGLADALGRWMRRDEAERREAGAAARERIGELCDPRTIAARRIEWLGSLAVSARGCDDELLRLFGVQSSAALGGLHGVLQAAIDRMDRVTGASARSDDTAAWVGRVRGTLEECAAKGRSPVALYGAGHFARNIGPALVDPPVEVVCIIDDATSTPGRELHGLSVVSQREAIERGVRAVVLCANQWEERLWESARELRRAGIEVVRLFGRAPRVLLVESGSDTRHFAGVAERLRELGVEVSAGDERAVYPRPDESIDLVCVADVHTPRSIAVLRAARAMGIRTLLVMDGVVEWRNTFVNPYAGADFLRPAPVDFVCCATTDDERHLRELGNEAWATGLPRLDSLTKIARDPDGPVLIATANTPWFSDDERSRLIEALRELNCVAADRGLSLRWRLTGGLEGLLGVENTGGSLVDSMRGCRGVISTPSTLLLEAALAGLPIAVLDPFGQPSFVGMTGVVRSARAGELFDSLGDRGSWAKSAYPPLRERCDGAGLVAERIAAAAGVRGETRAAAPPLSTMKLPDALAKGERPRAVSVIVCDGSPTSGVTSFSLRMSEESAARETGWEWHTLLVQTRPKHAANDGLRELEPETIGHVDVCVLDPTADHHELIRTCRDAVERLGPDVVVPNYSDLAWAVAAQLRHRGVRTLGIMHSDDDAYRRMLRERPVWDGGVAVSAECAVQMGAIAGEVFESIPPVEQITYGVPVASAIEPGRESGPLRLVYVGRLVEHQKRVSRLIELAKHLREIGCAFELDVIGDGPSEDSLRAAIERERLGGCVRLRGRRTPDEVRELLGESDALVLVSDFEGTSVAMLEAMGRGVVPCVSRVASGVDEWVRDGENGLTAPVGDVCGLAEKIARLGRDRSMLERMRLAAWETVRACASTGAMFDRYAQVLDGMMRRPLTPARDALGLHLTEGGRWLKSWSDDPEGAERWARSVLHEAGYRSVARGRPQPGCDAVLVDTELGAVEACEVDEWRAAGLGVAFVPLVICPGWVRLGATIRRAMDAGSRRVALYGAGLHTRRALPLLREHLPIVGVIDDRERGELCGLPVVGPSEAVVALGCDGVVLSSDTVEDRLWAASEPLRASGLPVYAVYGSYGDSVGAGPRRAASV